MTVPWSSDNQYKVQPSPYSGDGLDLRTGFDLRCDEVGRVERSDAPSWKMMSSEELGLIDHVVVPPAKRFLSRFRTRRHA